MAGMKQNSEGTTFIYKKMQFYYITFEKNHINYIIQKK